MAIIIFSVISCSDEIDTTNEGLRVQQILHKYAEAWRAKNMDLFGELFSDDIDMIILDHCPCSFFFSESIIIRSKQKLTHTQRFQLTRLAVVSSYYCNLKGRFVYFRKF